MKGKLNLIGPFWISWTLCTLQNEIMSGFEAVNMVLSRLTLALFEDSGWALQSFYNQTFACIIQCISITVWLDQSSPISHIHACMCMLHVRSWYEVNYDNAEQLRYGRNLGCSFSEENCLTYGYANLIQYKYDVYWCIHACCCYN